MALPDNLHALSGSDDKTVKLFNVNDGAVLRTFCAPRRGASLALLPDGLRFVSGSYDKTARIAYHGLAPLAEHALPYHAAALQERPMVSRSLTPAPGSSSAGSKAPRRRRASEPCRSECRGPPEAAPVRAPATRHEGANVPPASAA